MDEIGRGGMGIVYRALDLELEREVALKVLPAELSRDPERIALLKREARAIAALRHPRIVTVHSVEEADGVCFLTMECISGQPLDRVIPSGGLPLRRFFELAIPLADALSTAHEAGVIHRDLKPHNIVVSDEGRPTILDFGLARAERPMAEVSQLSTRTISDAGRIGGTVPYMSPEQVRGDPLDARSDIFSFGIILFEMATGRHPFRSRTEADLISAILRDRPVSVTDLNTALPRHLARIIRHALEKDPEHRLQTAKDLRNELEALRDELTLDPELALPRAGRPRRLAIAAAVAALALAALATVSLLRPPAAISGHRSPYVEVAVIRAFAGSATDDALRLGIRDSLVQRMGAIRGAFVLPDTPELEGDLRLEMDARWEAGTVAISYRLYRGEEAIAGDALEGTERQLLALEDEVGEALARTLRRRLGYPVTYRSPHRPEIDPPAFEHYLRGSQALLSGAPGAIDEAITWLERAVGEGPRFAPAHAALGEARRQRALLRGVPEDALLAQQSCARAATLDPDLGAAHSCLGQLAAGDGLQLEAAHSFLRAIERDPTAHPGWEGLKRAHRALGSPEAGEAALRRAIAYRPDYWAGHYYLGRYFSESGRYEEAIAEYEEALRNAPDSSTVLTSLGGTLFLLGRYEEATVTLHRSLAVHPTFAAYSNLGNTFHILRRPEEAVEAFRKAVEFEGASHVAWGNLARACRFSARHRGEADAALATAVELALQRLTIDPADSDTRIQLAVYRALQGDRKSALALLNDVLAARPGDPHVAFSAGQIHNLLGDEERALEWLERAVASGYSTAEIRGSVEFDNLRHDRRFDSLLAGRSPPPPEGDAAPG